jgi:hypothetical protein
MKSAEVKIKIVQTDTGRIRINFLSDGSSYPIPDCMENIGILSGLEVELKYVLKKLELEESLPDEKGVSDEDIDKMFPVDYYKQKINSNTYNLGQRAGAKAFRDGKIKPSTKD